MRRPAVFLAAGALAFVAFLVILLPAPVMMRWMPAQVALSGLQGTLWSGQASEIRISGQPLGALTWQCRYWRILLLQWSCDVELRPTGGSVTVQVTRFPTGTLRLQDATGSLPIRQLEGLFTPPGWTGQAELDVSNVDIEGDWPANVEGTLRVRALKAPGPGGAHLGDFELVIRRRRRRIRTVAGAAVRPWRAAARTRHAGSES